MHTWLISTDRFRWNFISRILVRVRYGSFFSKEPFDMPVERFLASLRFENRGKLGDLGLDIDTNPLKPGD
jgi:hypothetical protein